MVFRITFCCFAVLLVIAGCTQAQPSNKTREFKRHVTLTDEQVSGRRIMVIGDVHGCYDEMMDLLREANVLARDGKSLFDDAMVIFTGDTVNKGPKSAEVLRFIRTTERVYTVRGNHEDNCLEEGAAEKYPWLKDCPAEDCAILNKLPYTISIPKFNAHIVHAGLLPDGRRLEDQSIFVMTRMRNIDVQLDGTMIPYEEKGEGGRNWAKVWSEEQSAKHVYYGHDAGRGKYGPQMHDFATGLDTRCSKGGELTGVFMPVADENFKSVSCPDYRMFSLDVDD